MGKAQWIRLLAPLPVLALLLALLLGCASGSPVTAPAPTATLVPLPTATPDAPPPTATPDLKHCEQYAPKDSNTKFRSTWDNSQALRVLDLAPGYGGFFYSPTDDIVYAWILDTSQGQVVKQAVEQVYGKRITRGIEFRVLQGRYNIAELLKWSACIKAAAFADGLEITLNSIHNRITINPTNDTNHPLHDADVRQHTWERRIKEKLEEIGVPRDAVTFRDLELCRIKCDY